jgi:hypothetical protein
MMRIVQILRLGRYGLYSIIRLESLNSKTIARYALSPPGPLLCFPFETPFDAPGCTSSNDSCCECVSPVAEADTRPPLVRDRLPALAAPLRFAARAVAFDT